MIPLVEQKQLFLVMRHDHSLENSFAQLDELFFSSEAQIFEGPATKASTERIPAHDLGSDSNDKVAVAELR